MSSYFFQLSGFSEPFLGSTALYVVLIIGVLLAVFLVERAGRRRLILIGATICILCDFAIGGLAFAPITGPGPKVIVAMVCIWMAGYSISLQSVEWVYLGEIASVSLRAKSIGVTSVFQSSIILMLVSRLSCTRMELTAFCRRTRCRSCCRLKRLAGEPRLVSLFDAMMKSRPLISMPIGFFFGSISVLWIALIYFVCPEASMRLAI
jgi:hypothetical protein